MILFAATQEVISGTIKGRVRETKTKSAIVGADVFIVGTSMGEVTDTNGVYVINNVPAGKYKIAVYAVGYSNKEESINVLTDTSQVVENFAISEKAITLTENVIEARADNTLETAARATEKNSDNVVSVISAEAIERSTDLTAADAMQRVSGMSLVREQGEARYVVMRGLEQQYNNTLVDGIKIPSPEAKDRFVPLDIFPSSLFERIETEKSITPDLPGDAIGGSTDLILRKAPENFTFSLSAASGAGSGVVGNSFNTFDRSAVNDLDPDRLHGTVDAENPTQLLTPTRYKATAADFTTSDLIFTNKAAPPNGIFNGIIGDRFFDNRLGIMVSGAVQDTYEHMPVQFYSNITENINRVDADGHLTPYPATYDDHEYYTNRIRSGAVVNADFIASEDQVLSATYLYVSQEEAETRNSVETTIDGTRGAADFTYLYRSALRTQDESSISLEGKHFTNSPLLLTWTLNYTDALQDRPDEAEYSVYDNYDSQHNLSPVLGLDDITHEWRRNDDHQYLGKLDGTFHVTSDGTETLQAGAVVQQLQRANYDDAFLLKPVIATSGPYKGQTQPFTSIDSAVVFVFTTGNSVYGYENYKASEVLLAAYLEYTAVLGQLQILGGVRWEQTHDYYYTMADLAETLRQADIHMVDFLPGIHFRYELTSEQIIHLSVTRSISRPSYFDLVPLQERSDESATTGNPNLRQTRSTNLDLRYEYYPNSSDVYSAGVYYKRITDPIVDSLLGLSSIRSTEKSNGDPATVYGFEAVVSKHFGGFGISANYTYVFSTTTSRRQVTVEDANGDIKQLYYEETRQLESQSPQIANIILSYDNLNWGTSVELAYNYTGRSLDVISGMDGWDIYKDGLGNLDFSGEQTLFLNLKLNVRLTNLTNSQEVREVPAGQYVKHASFVVERDLNKIGGSVGISYNF